MALFLRRTIVVAHSLLTACSFLLATGGSANRLGRLRPDRICDALSPKPESPAPPKIFVDADACPVAVKEIVYRVAQRRQVHTVVVANQLLAIPKSEWIRGMTVASGADQADHAIVEMVQPGDLVIADDIPLAARVVEKGGLVIGSRGALYDEKNVRNRLATRDLMEQLRSAGLETDGPRPFMQKDAQAFANQLDRTLTKRLRQANKRSD